MRFAFSTNAFRDHDLTAAVEAVGAAGYDGVELLLDEPHLYPPDATAADLDRVRAALDRTGLTVSNGNAFMLTALGDFHHPSFVEADPDERRQRVAYTRAALETAADLGLPHVSIEPGGPVPEGTSRERALDLFEAGLRDLLPTAAETGVTLLVEPEPDLLVETSDEFLDLVDRVDSPHVRLNFDAGHFFCVGEDPAALVERLSPYADHYHLEDIPADRRHEHTRLGDGAMDLDGFLAALEDAGYDGFVTVELYPYRETAAETARAAMDWLRERGWA